MKGFKIERTEEDIVTPEDDILKLLRTKKFPVSKVILLIELYEIAGWNISRITLDHCVENLIIKGFDIKDINDELVLVRYSVDSQDKYYRTLGEIKTPFMVAADLHVGSKTFSEMCYNNMMKDIEEYSITDVLLPGDIFQGRGVHRMEMSDVALLSITDQINETIRLLNRMPDKTRIHAVIGNHAEKIKGCFEDITTLLTKEGFKKYDELIIGEDIMSFNKETKELEWQPLEHLIVKDYKGEMTMLSTENRSFEVLTTPSHRTPYYGYKNPQISVAPASQVPFYKYLSTSLPTQGIWSDKNLDAPYSDDEIKLIAWIITEGGSEPNQPRVYITQSYRAHKVYCSQIKDFLNNLKELKEYVFTEQKRKDGMYVWRFNAETSVKILKMMNNDVNFIPQNLMDGSLRQINILKDELIKGDGSKKHETRSLYTSEPKLRDQYIELFLKTGLRVLVHSRPPSEFGEYKTKENWIVYGSRGKAKWRIRRKEFVDYEGKVWCPSVKNTFVVVQRKDHIFISGNSVEVGLDMPQALVGKLKSALEYRYYGHVAKLQVDNIYDLVMLHGSGGMGYSIGYMMQKIDRNLIEHPNFLVAGHLHQLYSLPRPGHRNYIMGGTMQRENSYLINKGIVAQVGYLIIDKFNNSGSRVIYRTPETW